MDNSELHFSISYTNLTNSFLYIDHVARSKATKSFSFAIDRLIPS